MAQAGAQAAAQLAEVNRQSSFYNGLLTGNAIAPYSGGSTGYGVWTDIFEKTTAQLSNRQRLDLLRAKV